MPKKKKVRSEKPYELKVGDAVSAMAEIFDGDRRRSYLGRILEMHLVCVGIKVRIRDKFKVEDEG